jgi:hypothetical protein
MLDSGIDVGLGLDSAASSGPIDMFAELRMAMRVSEGRGEPISGPATWNMATTMGAKSLWISDWDVQPEFRGSLLQINLPSATSTEEVIETASPKLVQWIRLDTLPA